jgi:serine/threonine protein kinase
MDDRTAEEMSAALVGKTIGGWVVQEYINHGKSAVIFLARRGEQDAALKIFDREIVQRYGRDAQLNRIKRELSLVGKLHPNLVAIYGGGEDSEYLFVAMEYFPGRNLAEALLDVPASEVRSLISQISSAAKFLEDSSFAHRDIKPENIGLSPDMKSAKLLDLGVIRPFDLSNVTDDGDQHFFIGTLQYSPPELLFREEEQSVEGWRAISFYQLGGVLHDMLMRKPLFEDFKNPYARLVRAVEREIPRIDAVTDADLRLLAQNCLAKVARHRLDTVKWEDFSQPEVTDPLDAARRSITQHRVAAMQKTVPQAVPADMLAAQCFTLNTSIYSAIVNAIKAEGMPRYSLQKIREPNPYLLRVFFEPSARDGLENYFAFYCEGAPIDPAANMLQLQLWACVSIVRELVPAEPDPSVQHLTVKGALIEQDIRTHVQRNLLLAYAQALDSSLGSGQVAWLKVGSNII